MKTIIKHVIRSSFFTALAASLYAAPSHAVEVDASERYFKQDGQAVFLLGHYAWASIDPTSFIDHPSTYKKMIDTAAAHGLNYVRAKLGVNRFSADTYPSIYGGSGATPTPFLYVNGKADLNQWDARFWDGLDELLAYAAARDVIVHVSIFDGVTIRGGNYAYRWTNSFWNIDNQRWDFVGDLDANGNGSADQNGDFYQLWGFNNPSADGSAMQRLGYYQRRVIDKALAAGNGYSNVFFEVGNELHGSTSSWNQAVVSYIKARTSRAVTVNPGELGAMTANADGYSEHYHTDNVGTVKSRLSALVGNGVPAWLDPDGGDLMYTNAAGNRRAAWTSLAAGAAGWGGFTRHYWDNNNSAHNALMTYYGHLSDFLESSGLPLARMQPAPAAISNSGTNSLLAQAGKHYLAYMPWDSSVSVDLAGGDYEYFAYDPVSGSHSNVSYVSGGGRVSFSRPGFISSDWVLYVRAQESVVAQSGGDVEPEALDVNLALGQPFIVTSTADNSLVAANATDGDANTRWSSEYSDLQFAYVDLGQATTFNEVTLDWALRAWGEKYMILVSDNLTSWQPLYYEGNGDAGSVSIDLGTQRARYVGVYMMDRANEWGYSIWEFGVYNR